jgi:hypothetical protein
MPKKPSSWSLLVSMIDRPGVALTDIVANPRWRWVLPTTLAVLTTAATAAVTAPLLAEQAKQAMAGQLNRLPAEQLAQVQTQLALFQSPAFVGGTAAVTGILMLFLGWLLGGALLYFLALLAGGDVEFGRVFAATPWLGLPFVLESILQTVYALTRGQLLVNRGLSYLVSSGKPLVDARTPSYVALSQVSLFWLWHLLLIYMLFRHALKFGRGTALTLTTLYAAVTVGGRVGLALLGGLMTPAL